MGEGWKTKVRGIVTSSAVFTVAAALALPAGAAEVLPTPTGSDSSSVVTSIVDTADEIQFIAGGTTQSTDPTRYDYVAPPTPGAVQPMDASGFGPVGGFSYSWEGLTIAVPAGRIYHEITGSGLTVTHEMANYVFLLPTGVQMCNTQWQFQNRYGSTIYGTWKGTLQAGCYYGYLPNYTRTTSRP